MQLETLAGSWALTIGNARVVSATGDHAGGTVALSGDRYVFTAGGYRSEVPIDMTGTVALDCNATRCRMDGVAPLQIFEIREVDGELKVVNAMMLTPIGSLGGVCGFEDAPGAGVVRVVSTGDVGGQTVPTVLEFTAANVGGVGNECSEGGHVVAWDITATRQP